MVHCALLNAWSIIVQKHSVLQFSPKIKQNITQQYKINNSEIEYSKVNVLVNQISQHLAYWFSQKVDDIVIVDG